MSLESVPETFEVTKNRMSLEVPRGVSGGGDSEDLDCESDEEVISEIKESIKETQRTQQFLVKDMRMVKSELSNFCRQTAIDRLTRKIDTMQEESKKFEEFITSEVFKAQNKDKEDLIAAFAMKWNPYQAKQLYSMCWMSWLAFVRQQNKYREALRRTKSVYAKIHISSRLKTWWYLMSKHNVDTKVKAVTDVVIQQEAQLDELRVTNMRQEKAVTEQARQIVHKITEIESTLGRLEIEKAREDDVGYRFDDLNKRLEEEYDLEPLKNNISKLQMGLNKLEDTKMDYADMEKDRKQNAETAREHQAWLLQHEEALKLKAATTDMDCKADAKTIEQVLVLLARQADHLAKLVAHDIEQVRSALGRFLEISPDFRKAALALGLEPVQECVSCRPLKKLLPEGATGVDNNVYRISGEGAAAAQEQTRKILKEQIGFPPALLSSIQAGLQGRVQHDTQQGGGSALPQLQAISNKEAGWLAAKDIPNAEEAQQTPRQNQSPFNATPRRKYPTAERCIAQESGSSSRPLSSRKYFPAVPNPPPLAVSSPTHHAPSVAMAASSVAMGQPGREVHTPRAGWR
eukprot:TRINITY_DN4324_c0_g1_i7.p1 TRINITY_DN4324_c0_g1~~TRINITY_DN4324_c0_g1_i7.p1  ORF type:complete len:593 (+),score=111.78 TRINITY_DN4324_c0_g1_i7:59-1780(+)